MKRVFIDGSAGTTGLRIRERLSARGDICLDVLPEEFRKDASARRDALNSCDVAILCLPDAAAVEAAGMVENPAVAVIDTSTAHRTAPDWQYGFPELKGLREKICSSKRIANPGCHASGFIALVAPLVEAGIVARDERLCAFSLTGYSGGGKKMIADYETAATPLHAGGRQYALSQNHKHLPEMAKVCGLDFEPCFSPVVVPHRCGMEVTVQLAGKDMRAIGECYADYYSGSGMVSFAGERSEEGFLSSAAFSGRDGMEICVFGNPARQIVVSRFDNLGKGASGAAIQNLNIVLGVDEKTGLVP
ncbi:MAG: N-acetyl-gamma-glutamyl-phosphate reductase [Kiritimatiellae bacterium]|nr:N-acetyl-gamma-glutamyl-phosphate reductase [Kiritimatiellia bacterium]